MDLATLIRKGSRDFAGRPAVLCDGTVLSYAGLHRRACRLDNALHSLGVGPGECVATLADNSPETVEQIFGVALGGRVRCSLFTHNSPEVNATLLNDVGVSALLVQRRHYDALAPYLGSVSKLRHVIVFDGEVPEGVRDYEELLSAASTTDRGARTEAEEPQIIRFSAGTTGRPKPIVHSVRAWTAVGTEMQAALPEMSFEDRYLIAGPLTHSSIMTMPAVLAAGGSLMLLRAFDAAVFLRAIEEEGCTVTFGVPTMVQLAAQHPSAAEFDLSSLRLFVYGGSPMTETASRQARHVFGDVLHQIYGQSEGAPLTHLPDQDHRAQDGKWLRSAGKPTPNTVLTVVDSDGTPVPPGQVGEIAARTPTAFDWIWANPQETKERKLSDGSILTKDMGYVDEHGYLFLTDRKEDMIISGGLNVWPAEIENALAAHPAVREVGVVGIPHDKWGETPMALVVPVEGAEVTEGELIQWTKDRLGSVKRVTHVRFGEELPKTGVGKVARRQVRDLYAPKSPVQER